MAFKCFRRSLSKGWAEGDDCVGIAACTKCTLGLGSAYEQRPIVQSLNWEKKDK